MRKKLDVYCLKSNLLGHSNACTNKQDWMIFRLFQDSENNATKSLLDMENSLSTIYCNGHRKQHFLVPQGAANEFDLTFVVSHFKRDSLSIGIIVLGNSSAGKLL